MANHLLSNLSSGGQSLATISRYLPCFCHLNFSRISKPVYSTANLPISHRLWHWLIRLCIRFSLM